MAVAESAGAHPGRFVAAHRAADPPVGAHAHGPVGFHYSAYYDTLADMASTLVGAAVGAMAGVYAASVFRRRSS
jgi:hypothetical protein